MSRRRSHTETLELLAGNRDTGLEKITSYATAKNGSPILLQSQLVWNLLADSMFLVLSGV
jgi:hypothetical protein